MKTLRLALRNTRRRPGRTLLTTLAIGLAVASVTFIDAYMSGIVTSVLEAFIHLDAGHVKVMPREAEDRARPLPLDKGITGIDTLVTLFEQVPGVLDVAPRIQFGVLLDKPGGSIPAIGIAILPSKETGLLALEDNIVEGSLPEDNSAGVLLGADLASELGIGVGDELFMVASDAYGGFGPGLYIVSGLTRMGIKQIDRKTFYVPLPEAQEQLAMENSALEIVLRVENGIETAPEAAERIQEVIDRAGFERLVAVPWQRQGIIYQAIKPAQFTNLIMMLLMGVLALTTVVNTVLMSVMERTREIGALRALGYYRREVLRLIMAESLVIGIVSTFGGIVLGMTISLILNNTGIDFSSAFDSVNFPMKPIIYPEPKLATAIQSAIFGLLISVVAAWHPARVAVRLQPAGALRAE